MLDQSRIRYAVALQKRSYRLFRWMTEAIDRGFIRHETATKYATLPEATSDWITSHYNDIPLDAKPEKNKLQDFCQMFSTFIESSLEISSAPGKRLASSTGCYCPEHAWLVDASSLKTQKLSRKDKERAKELRRHTVARVARDAGIQVSLEQVDELLGDLEMQKATSLLAYGEDLIRRVDGLSVGRAALVLWRGFAWHPKGSPIKNFELRAEDIVDAEAQILDAIKPKGV